MGLYSSGPVPSTPERIARLGENSLSGEGQVRPIRGRTGAADGLFSSLGLRRGQLDVGGASCKVGRPDHWLLQASSADSVLGKAGARVQLSLGRYLTTLRGALNRISRLLRGVRLTTGHKRLGWAGITVAVMPLLIPLSSWGDYKAVDRDNWGGHGLLGRTDGASYEVSSDRPPSPAGSGTNVTTTFRVAVSPQPAFGWWSVTGLGRGVRVGAVMHRDSAGRVDGYWAVADAGPITITGTPAFPAHPSWSSYAGATSTTIVALYANLNNPPTPPVLGDVISPGSILDMSVYNAGTGTGWVARDHRTGNGLLLKVSGANSGTLVCNTSSPAGCAASTTISQLNAESPFAFATSLGSSAAVRSALYNSIPGNEPMVAMGCIAQSQDGTGRTTPCVGGGLQVSLTPVGVISGQALSSEVHRGGASSGDWSPAGTYYLYLTGVIIYG